VAFKRSGTLSINLRLVHEEGCPRYVNVICIIKMR